MKKFEIVKITQPVDLGDYYEEYRGGVVHVWVNPPKTMRREREALLQSYAEFIRDVSGASSASGVPLSAQREKPLSRILRLFQQGFTPPQDQRLRELDRHIYGWFARLWSQHADRESHWTVDEIEALKEADPALYKWLVGQSTMKIDTFHADKKK